jgi:hypothetical protein
MRTTWLLKLPPIINRSRGRALAAFKLIFPFVSFALIATPESQHQGQVRS